jgi:UDP-N-acetylmuramate: L-alanyl-gamma-D-glutamyl-meso-diaminopimelate ligase
MASFARKDLEVFTNAQQFRDYLYNLNPTKAVLLLMSSGNYGGLDLIAFKSHIERD